MAREIKFRAWDIERKKMAYNVQYEYDTIGGVEFEDGTEPGENCFADYLKYAKAFPYDKTAPNRYIVEQYTGLHDKNGREIYEGDIVTGYYGRVEVAYNEEDAGFYPFSRPSYGGYEYECYNVEDSEVVGNIHQNPELLNG